MQLVSSLLSSAYEYFYPEIPVSPETLKSNSLSFSFRLLLGAAAQESLPVYVAKTYPNRNYHFTPLSSPLNQEASMEVGSNRFMVVEVDEGKPYASGYQPGFVVLMRSSTHLGVVRVSKTINPLKQALIKMKNVTEGKFELFIIGGKASNSKQHEGTCRFIRCFNETHDEVVKISDDLFRVVDFTGPSPSQKPDVQFAGFDQDNNPTAVIDYR